MLKNWVTTFFRMFLETLPLFGLIFLINPILIVFSKNEPIDYNFSFLILGVVCVCASILTAFPISFFSNTYRRIAVSSLRSLFLVIFVVSFFYPESGRHLDGVIDETPSLSYYCIVYSIYVLSFSLLMFFFIRGNTLLRNMYVTFSIFGLLFVIYRPFHHLITFEPLTHYSVYSDQTPLTFASDKNVVVILADMLQGSTVEQYFTMHPDEKKDFEGFTLFSRATSPFPFTSYGAPAILTGNVYNSGSENSSAKAQNEAIASSFITDAENSGFDSTVIGLDTMPIHNKQHFYKASTPIETAKILGALSIQRITKMSMHTTSLDPTTWLIGYKKTSKSIMDRLAVAPIGKNKNNILFFHNMIPHMPIIFKRKDLGSMPLLLKPLEDNVENYWEEMAFFFGQLKRLVEHMKSIGIYDKSLIIIVADHGHHIGGLDNLYDYPGAEDFEGFQKGAWARTAALYNPAILVKPPMKNDSFQISRVASSNLGIRSLIKGYLTNGNSDLLKDFESLKNNKVVVFKDNIRSDPFTVSDDHVVLDVIGNVSSLAQQFEKDRWRHFDIQYKVGTKVTNTHNYLDGHWIKGQDGGGWLKGRKFAKMVLHTSGIEKKPYKLQMELKGLLSKQHPVQKVRISLNKKEIGQLSVTTPAKSIVALDIPMNLLVNNGINEFKLEPLDAITPKEIGAWDYSTAPISVYLYSFQLLESEGSEKKTP